MEGERFLCSISLLLDTVGITMFTVLKMHLKKNLICYLVQLRVNI